MTKDSKLDDLDDDELIEYLESKSNEDLVADATTPDEDTDIDIDEKEELAVKIEGEKAGVLKSVHFKVSEIASIRLHLDNDDANAFNLKTGDTVELLRLKN